MLTKQLKKFWRPKFQEDASKYYPTKVFEKYGFHSAKCPHCGTLYWRRTERQTTCGDSDCLGSYTFLREDPRDMTCEEVFASFKDHFYSASIPHNLVNRYPCVARWRDDCEFTAAGIYCYQPFCVTGEVDPPANPLIYAQFCLRFNDLDSIGLSGRHYSGFHMLGIQVFNKENARVYWNEEIVEFNIQWLQKLNISLDDVTFTADCWAGGGNLGPCVEYFIHGLEIGNMVFMQFKSFSDGHIEELPVQVIDVGIGLERIPWLLSGNVTSYLTAFPAALNKFIELTGFDRQYLTNQSWKHFGPRSCLLNIDECQDIYQTWANISQDSGIDAKQFKDEIEIVHDLYIVLDHLRTLLVAIYDGALPSNVGGGCNLRNVLRRLLTIMERRGWLSIGVDGVYEIMQAHAVDLRKLHGPESFPEFKPLKIVLELEIQRWRTTDYDAYVKLQKMLKKNAVLPIADWVLATTTYGIDPDTVAAVSKQPIPADLYSKIAEQQELNYVKQLTAQLYFTQDMRPTEQVYYTAPHAEELCTFENAVLVQVLEDLEADKKKRILIFDKTVFYPLSGGQANDVGFITTDKGESIEIVDVRKVGPVVFHYAASDAFAPFSTCTMHVNEENRYQLMCHHTGAHIISAACRRVLGPHIWQAGAKKTAKEATLDITHFRSLSDAEEVAIEKEANRIIRECLPITKETLLKNEAERKYGFSLYQGGVVPGSSVRCVCIQDTDFEACCGTHLSNTGRVGMLRIVRSKRVSDGVVRITFVAGEAALAFMEEQQNIIGQLKNDWGVEQQQIVATGNKFFSNQKKLTNKVDFLYEQLFKERMAAAKGQKTARFFVYEETPTRYISTLGEFLVENFVNNGKLETEFFFLGADFAVCVGSELATKLEQLCKQIQLSVKKSQLKAAKGKSKAVIDGCDVLMCVKISPKQREALVAQMM